MNWLKRRKDKKQNKNRGFTLVEVLVAVAILGVAVAPILSSFVSVARVNSTSRKRLSATIVAESLMETVKATSLKEVAKQCVFTEDGFSLVAGDLESGKSFTDGGGSACELTKETGSLLEKAAGYSVTKNGAEVTFVESADGYYHFFIQNIAMGGSTYDAILTYDLDEARSNQTFTDSEGVEIPVKDTLGELAVKTLRYYTVTIDVYKSGDKTLVNELVADYVAASPLATMSGTKTDYN